jgi:MFS family permease
MTVDLIENCEAEEIVSAPAKPLRKGLLAVLFATLLAQSLVCWAPFSFSGYMVVDFGLVANTSEAGTYAGYIAGIFLLTSVPSCLLFGWAADKIGRRKCLLINSSVGCVFYMAFSLSPTFAWAITLRGIAGLVSACYPVAKCVVNDVYGGAHRAQAFAVITTSWGVGAIIGPSISGLLSRPAIQYPRTFASDGFFGLYPYALQGIVISSFVALATGLAWCFLPETLPRKSMMADLPLSSMGGDSTEGVSLTASAEGKSDAHVDDADGVPDMVHSKPTLKHAVAGTSKRWEAVSIDEMPDSQRKKLILRCVLTFSAVCGVTSGRDELIPLLAMADLSAGGYGFGTAEIGAALMIIGGFLLLSQVLYFFAVKRFGPLVLLRAALVIYGPTMLLWPALGPLTGGTAGAIWPAIVFTCFVSSAANSFCFTSINVLMNTAAGPERAGRVNGVASAICSLLSAIAPLLASPTFAWSASAGCTWLVFLICGVITLACVALTIRIPASLG